LRIADCGFIYSENPAFIAAPLAQDISQLSIRNPQSAIRNPLRGVSHIGALWYIPVDTKSQNIQSQTEKRA
jgi:hypothetical protein